MLLSCNISKCVHLRMGEWGMYFDIIPVSCKHVEWRNNKKLMLIYICLKHQPLISLNIPLERYCPLNLSIIIVNDHKRKCTFCQEIYSCTPIWKEILHKTKSKVAFPCMHETMDKYCSCISPSDTSNTENHIILKYQFSYH